MCVSCESSAASARIGWAIVRRSAGKFIGEVERGEKSISIDSLYRVSVALEVPLRHLTDVRPGRRAVVPSEAAEKIFAIVSGKHRPLVVRRAYEVLRAMLDKG